MCVLCFFEFEVTGKCSTQSWTSCFCPPTVTSVRLINLPSFIDRHDQTGKESLLFPLPQTVTWGAEKHDTPNTHPGTQSDGRNMPVPALVQPIYNPFCSICAWLNTPSFTWLCEAATRCKKHCKYNLHNHVLYIFSFSFQAKLKKIFWRENEFKVIGDLRETCLTPETSSLILD